MTTDAELLRSYVRDASEEAFAEIVRRHVNLVYGVALRQLAGNVALAQDVTQAVFTALAAKAGKLQPVHHVAGWLHGTARLTASHAVRAERRRQARERKAQAMHDLLSEPESPEPGAISPAMLDGMLESLARSDREAVLLRFYEGQSFLAIGNALGVGEDAARMRVTRALDKIRRHFATQGIASSAAAVGAALANQAIAAPPALAAAASAAALSATAAIVAPIGAEFGLLASMTTTKVTLGFTSAIAVIALGLATYEYRDVARSRESAAQLNAERDRLAGALRQTEQRLSVLEARALAAQHRNAEGEGQLNAAPSAPVTPATPSPRRATELEAEARRIAAEKMAKMKPLLEAGMPIRGAVVVLVDGTPAQRPVEFVMGKETRIESVDDGTYVITPALDPDGSVRYSIKLLVADADGKGEKSISTASVIATPWGSFSLGARGRTIGFDPDQGEPP